MIRKTRVKHFVAMRPGSAIPAAGDRLYDFTTDAINLGLGAFGLYVDVPNSGNPEAVDAASITADNVQYMKFILHRDTTADRTPLPTKTLEESAVIGADCFVRVNALAAATKQNSSWVVGAPTTAVNAVPVESLDEYVLNVGSRGWRVDLYNGNNTPFKMGRYTSPNFVGNTFYTTVEQQRDLILHNLVDDFNSNGNTEVVALAIDSQAVAAVGTTTSIAAAAALSVGDSIIIGYDRENQPYRLFLDEALIQTFADMIASGGLTGAELIVPAAVNTSANLAAGVIVGGGVAAGTPQSNVDHIILLSLDPKLAYYDEVSQTKNRIQVGVDGAFGLTTNSIKLTDPSEGAGYARDVIEQYRGSHGHRQYIGNKPWQQYHVEYPNELVDGAFYDIFVVDFCYNRIASSGMPSNSPHTVTVAVANTEIGDANINPLFTGAANPQKAFVQDALNAFMANLPFPHTPLAI